MTDQAPKEAFVTTRLAVYRDDLEPPAITARLGLEPTEAFRRGEPIIGRKRRYGDHPSGAWMIESRTAVASEDIAEHLRWLLERITPVSDRIRSLTADGLRVELVCVLEAGELGDGPALTPELLRDLADIGLTVYFDIYC